MGQDRRARSMPTNIQRVARRPERIIEACGSPTAEVLNLIIENDPTKEELDAVLAKLRRRMRYGFKERP